jgi:hypothetical protein
VELVVVAIAGFLVGVYMLIAGVYRRDPIAPTVGLALIAIAAVLGLVIWLVLRLSGGE